MPQQNPNRNAFSAIFSWRSAFFALLISCLVGVTIEARLFHRVQRRLFPQTYPWTTADRALLDKMSARSIDGLSQPRRSDLLISQSARKSNIEDLISLRFAADPPHAMPYGILAFGLVQANRATPSREITEALIRMADKLCDREGRLTIHETVLVEQAMAGWLLLELGQTLNEPRYLKAAAEFARLYKESYPQSSDGTLSYFRGAKEQMLVDTVGLLCPFLARYGAIANDAASTDLAVRQILKFIEHGTNPSTGVPSHAYDISGGPPYGAPNWARGTGWMLIGVAETVAALPETNASRSVLILYWQKLAAELLRQQRPDGLWGWAFNDPRANSDTSASAMFAVALRRGIELGVLPSEYQLSVNRAIVGIARKTNQNGLLTQALFDCQGVGHYPGAFGPSPFAQGFGTAAIALSVASDNPQQ